MKSIISFLTFGALLAINGVVAAPVPEPAKIITVTRTFTKVYAVTSTTWVQPSETTKKNKEEEATKTSSTAETTSTTSSETTSDTPTTESSIYSTTSSTTTEEKTTTTATPTPTTTEEETIISIPSTTIELPTSTTITPELEPTNIQPPPPAEEKEEEEEEEEEEQSGGPTFVGEATYYAPGMGSCGVVNTENDFIAAISHIVMDSMSTGNPNNNPLCGKRIRCTRDGKNPTIVVVMDRCPGCAQNDLDLTPAAYRALGGTEEEGRFEITCQYIS